MTLTTIECSRPSGPYTLFESGSEFDLHLAGPGQTGGVGPILCGFDRFARDVGFSVGGGHTGPGIIHHVCAECAALAVDETVSGTNAELFAPSGSSPSPEEDRSFCTHCGVELVGPREREGAPPAWSHITHLNRCQSNDVPYGHEAHPAEQECPPWCMGAFEPEPCTHHVSPSPEAGDTR